MSLLKGLYIRIENLLRHLGKRVLQADIALHLSESLLSLMKAQG